MTRAYPVNTQGYKRLINHRDTETQRRHGEKEKLFYSSVFSLSSLCLCVQSPSTPQYLASMGNNRIGPR